MTIKTCIFDAYGTLFDVSAAARKAAGEPDAGALRECWKALAADWRTKQLQYTWLRSLSDAHTDFWTVTQNGLDWALEAHGLSGDLAIRERLLQLYWELDAFPEAPEMLRKLKGADINTGILSNGSPDMLNGAVESAGISDLLDVILSVESVKVFKPDKRVYDLVSAHFGTEANNVLFVSSNGWDAAGAAGYGFRTVWVNRGSEPVDRLPWVPDQILFDLKTIPELAEMNP